MKKSDYKEILKDRAYNLLQKLVEHKDKLKPEEIYSIKSLIDDIIKGTDGMLDMYEQDIKDKTIMNYHNKLDEAIAKLERFDEKESEEEKE